MTKSFFPSFRKKPLSSQKIIWSIIKFAIKNDSRLEKGKSADKSVKEFTVPDEWFLFNGQLEAHPLSNSKLNHIEQEQSHSFRDNFLPNRFFSF
jgi:hypothetical protein